MPAPLIPIIGGAIVRAISGKAAGKATAAAMAREAAKKKATNAAIKAAAKKKPLTTPKSAVRVKPPKKTIGNPPNLAKAESSYVDSVARAGGVKGPLGKKRDTRVFTSKKPTGKSK